MSEEQLEQVTEAAQEPVNEAAQTETSADLETEQKEPEIVTDPKPKGGFQRRIDELTSQRKAAEAREAAASAREEKLLALLEGRTKQETPASNVQQAPKLENFARYEDYLEAKAEYSAEQAYSRLKAKEVEESQKQEYERTQRMTAEQQQKQVLEKAAKWNNLVEVAEKKYPDFYDVMHADDLRISESMAEAILEAGDAGKEIAYYLGKHKSEAAAIAAMSPAKAILEMGRLEAKLQKSKSAAPAPIDPVTGSNVSTSTPTTKDDMATWIAKRNKQLGR